MNSRFDERAHSVSMVMRKYGATLVPAGAPREVHTTPLGVPPAISARLDSQWLTLVAPFPAHVRDRSPRRLLARNEGLPPAVRATLANRQHTPCLQADIPVLIDEPECDTLLAHSARDACEALVVAMESLTREPHESDGPPPPTRSANPAQEAVASLVRLCTESGWPFTAHLTSDISIALEVPHRFVQATIRPDSSGGVRLEAALLRGVSSSARSADAVALFLLTACGVTRLVRPSTTTNSACLDVRLDVSWPGLPCATELAIGLEALSVACRVVAREVESLCENSLAEAYLLIRSPAQENVHAA